MATSRITWLRTLIAALGIFAMDPVWADAPLAYETIRPARIKLGETATLRITSLDSTLKNVELPVVAGLAFEVLGHSQQLEFINGTTVASTVIEVRVTPQMGGLFRIPGLTPKSEPLILEVNVGDSAANPPLPNSRPRLPPPPPLASMPLPKGAELKAGGSAFVQLVVPQRAVYVGETVPIDIELGVRPEIVLSLNGPPSLNGSEFTLNKLSTQPERQERLIDGSPFIVLTWHSAIAAVKPGDYSLSVDTPITVKINTRSPEDVAFARVLGGVFLQNIYRGIVPKEVKITSPPTELNVLALPAEGRTADFSGAVGNFKITSDVSSDRPLVGDPVTLRLHVTGSGNFDRVDSPMLEHLDHWKTYPSKSSFAPSDSVGYKGEKVFEQPLIATEAGNQTIPELHFSYFDPLTRHYEHAQTAPLPVRIASSLADRSLDTPSSAMSGEGLQNSVPSRALRADHGPPQAFTQTLWPLYLQARFLAVPAGLTLLFAIGLATVRTAPRQSASKAASQTLAALTVAARSQDSVAFFNLARSELSKAFAARWAIAPEQISSQTLSIRLGSDGEELVRLWRLADEATYAGQNAGNADYPYWIEIIRRQLVS